MKQMPQAIASAPPGAAVFASARQKIASSMSTARAMLLARGCEIVYCADGVNAADAQAGAQRPVMSGAHPMVDVFFVVDNSVSVRVLRQLMESTEAETVILVSDDGPTPFTRRESEAAFGRRVQFFTHREVSVDVTQHVLVPPHALVTTPDEHRDASGYPRLFTSDPVARFYNFKPGDIVRIDRSRMNTTDTCYRIVCDA